VSMDAIVVRLSGRAPSPVTSSREGAAARAGADWSAAAGQHRDRTALRPAATVSARDASPNAVTGPRSHERPGTHTTRPGRQRRRAGGSRRWCLLLAATVASTLAFSLSASEAHAQYICWNGVIVVYGSPCPVIQSYPGPLKGLLGPTGQPGYEGLSAGCSAGTLVGFTTWRHPVNGYTAGIRALCQDQFGALINTGSVLGQDTGLRTGLTFCPAGQIPVGIYGRVGQIVDGIGLRCSTSRYGPKTDGPYAGGPGGFRNGQFDCLAGTKLKELVMGYVAPFVGGINVTSMHGYCADFQLSTFGSAPGAPSAPTGTTRIYRASDSQGPVKFRMLISKASGEPGTSWYYGIDRMVLATGCSQSTRVPGGTVISDRRKSSERSRFSWRRPGFRIEGRLSGPLARPEVRATVRLLKGACRGEVLSFKAAKPRSQG
jgi:hypothetical protein